MVRRWNAKIACDLAGFLNQSVQGLGLCNLREREFNLPALFIQHLKQDTGVCYKAKRYRDCVNAAIYFIFTLLLLI